MVYKVTAIHAWGLQLGIVEYMTGGDGFAELAKEAVERFPKMRFTLPVGLLSEDVVYSAIHNTMTLQLADFQLGASRATQNRATEFLKTIDAEYRRWKFEESMEGGYSGVMEDLVPLIKLHKANVAEGANLARTIVEYSIDVLAEHFAAAAVEEFSEAVEMFMTSYRGKITDMKLTLDFPQCQYGLMDMKLLIEVSEV